MHDTAAPVPAAPNRLPRLSLDWLVLMGGVLSLAVAVLATLIAPADTQTADSQTAPAVETRFEG